MLGLGVVVALRFPEEHFTAADSGRRWHAGLSLLSSAVRLAKGDRVLLLLSSAWLLVNGSGEAYGRLVDKRLIDLGFGAGDRPIVWFIALGLVTLTLGSATLRILERRIDDEDVARRGYIACCAAGVVGLALFASAPDARYAVAGVLLTTGCANPGAVVRALTEISVNQRTTSGVRATVHSLLSLAEHLGEIVLGLMLATLAGATSLTASLVGSAALTGTRRWSRLPHTPPTPVNRQASPRLPSGRDAGSHRRGTWAQGEFTKRLGLRVPEGGALTPKGLRDYRETYVATKRTYNAGEGNRMRSWNLPFLIRHSAFHAIDHAWEMEDNDLSARRVISETSPESERTVCAVRVSRRWRGSAVMCAPVS